MNLSLNRVCKIVGLIVTFSILALPVFASDEATSASRDRNHDVAIVLLVAYVALALLFSFLCSVAEAVLLSITPSYIEEQKGKHPKRAALMKKLKQENVDRSLAAILTLNTISHTAGAIGAGAQATILFGSAWFGVFSVAMTLAILFFSEIIPKTIGAVYWSKLAGPTAFFVETLIMLLFPVVWISESLTKIFSRGKAMHIFSRDEFIAMARVGEQTGQIHNNEARIIVNLFKFGSLRVTDIMTPRTVMSALPENIVVDDASEFISKTPFSRLPVYQDSIDDITGFVLKDEILLKQAQDKDNETLKGLKREISFVPKTVSLAILLETFLKDRQHIAVVVDEYGGTAGLVTLEDLVETLMGREIVDEMDTVADMQALARKKGAERVKAMDKGTP